MPSPADHEHAPHTQTSLLMMARPCSDRTAGTDSTGPAETEMSVLYNR